MPHLTPYEQAQNADALHRGWRREISKRVQRRAGQWERAAVQRAEIAALADILARLPPDEEATLP
jgi:hypothetical protein